MSKKKKKNKSKKRNTRPKQTAPTSKKRSKYPLLAMIAGGVLVLTGAYFLYQGEKPPTQFPELTELKKENINLRENRPDSTRDTGGARSSLLLLPMPRKLRPQKPAELLYRYACVHMRYLY
jgi:hypothetical protein